MIEAKFIGGKRAQRMFKALEEKTQRVVMRKALRKAGKTIREKIVQNLSGNPIEPRTGRLRDGMKAARIITQRTRKGFLRLGLPFPTRAELGISGDDKHFYPAVLEYGDPSRGIPPRSYIRKAVDDNAAALAAEIRGNVRRGIIAEARKAR